MVCLEKPFPSSPRNLPWSAASGWLSGREQRRGVIWPLLHYNGATFAPGGCGPAMQDVTAMCGQLTQQSASWKASQKFKLIQKPLGMVPSCRSSQYCTPSHPNERPAWRQQMRLVLICWKSTSSSQMTHTHTTPFWSFLCPCTSPQPTREAAPPQLAAEGTAWTASGGSRNVDFHLPSAALIPGSTRTAPVIRTALSKQRTAHLSGGALFRFHAPSSNTMFNSWKIHYCTFRYQSHRPSF